MSKKIDKYIKLLESNGDIENPIMTINSEDLNAEYYSDGSGSFYLPNVINEEFDETYGHEDGKINHHLSYIKEYRRKLEKKYLREVKSCNQALIIMESALKQFKNVK